MKIGIVGAGADKFTQDTARTAIRLIRDILDRPSVTAIVSGRSPMGGVDIWAETIGAEFGLELDIKVPKQNSWSGEYGYKERNLDIARSSDEVHVIVVTEYPPDYTGQKFKICYHCNDERHVKSGGCWTGWQAHKEGKTVTWHLI